MQSYFELFVYGVKSEEEDLVSSFLFDLGASGVSEKLDFIQTAENFDPRILTKSTTDLIAYFENPIEMDQFLLLKNYSSGLEIKVEAQKDWMNEWKKYYTPFEIAPQFWVVPEWIKSPVEDKNTVKISPGLAFGTGTHPTTQLMAEIIYDLLKDGQSKSYSQFLDVGAGTGILSILMNKLGILSGVATEIDPMAREKCLENLSLNHIQKLVSVEDESYLLKTQKQYPLVVANIIDGVLVQLGEDLKRCTSKTLVVSGVLDERKDYFEKNFIKKLNLKTEASYQKDIWWAFVFSK
jgi:ribosomal protein L11 methyltransferase